MPARAVGQAVSAATSWTPPAASPSASARRVLESLPEPATVPLPRDLRTDPGAGGTIAGAAPPASPPSPPESAITAGPAGSAPGACYEVQITATADPAKARSLADQAAHRLQVKTRVLSAGGLYRIRAGGCLDGAAAARLRDRARAGGYGGAFVTPAS
jgi:cell division septation protein DedD